MIPLVLNRRNYSQVWLANASVLHNQTNQIPVSQIPFKQRAVMWGGDPCVMTSPKRFSSARLCAERKISLRSAALSCAPYLACRGAFEKSYQQSHCACMKIAKAICVPATSAGTPPKRDPSLIDEWPGRGEFGNGRNSHCPV